jgi:DNA primase catalytic subunit
MGNGQIRGDVNAAVRIADDAKFREATSKGFDHFLKRKQERQNRWDAQKLANEYAKATNWWTEEDKVFNVLSKVHDKGIIEEFKKSLAVRHGVADLNADLDDELSTSESRYAKCIIENGMKACGQVKEEAGS